MNLDGKAAARIIAEPAGQVRAVGASALLLQRVLAGKAPRRPAAWWWKIYKTASADELMRVIAWAATQELVRSPSTPAEPAAASSSRE